MVVFRATSYFAWLFVYKSSYFPGALGVLLSIATFGNMLLPTYGEIYAMVVAITAFTGELLFTVWLLWKSVKMRMQ